MKPAFARIAYILCAFTFVTETANAAVQAPCKRFKIVFTDTVKDFPLVVYSNEEKVGKVELPQERTDNRQTITACIDDKYSGLFEKNSTCYVSNDRIVVYNVWSTGVDLKEGESVKGFTSRLALYSYEAQELLALIMDAAMAFARDLADNIIGRTSA